MERHKKERLERRETDKKLAAGKNTHAWFNVAAIKCKKAQIEKEIVEDPCSSAPTSRFTLVDFSDIGNVQQLTEVAATYRESAPVASFTVTAPRCDTEEELTVPSNDFSLSLTTHVERWGPVPAAAVVATNSSLCCRCRPRWTQADLDGDQTLVTLCRELVASHVVRPTLEADKLIRLLTSYGARCANSNLSKNALWSERYQPGAISDMCGNRDVVKSLSHWLKECRRVWALGRDGVISEDSSDECEDSRRNAVVLSGPTGVGKTALVYALAADLGFDVIEVSASDDRTGATIMRKLKESGESKQLSFGSSLTSLLNKGSKKDGKKKTKKRRKADCAAVDSSDLTKHRAPLIFFDEADLLLDSEADRGFLMAVTKLLDSAKCPIVIAVNDVHNIHHELKLEHHHMVRPATEELLMHLRMLCLVEGLNIESNELMQLISLHRHDHRRVITSIQAAVSEQEGDLEKESSINTLTPHHRNTLKQALLAPIVGDMSVDKCLGILSDGEALHELLSENYLRIMDSKLMNSKEKDLKSEEALVSLSAVADCADAMSVADLMSASAAVVTSAAEFDAVAVAAGKAALEFKSLAYLKCIHDVRPFKKDTNEADQRQLGEFVPNVTTANWLSEHKEERLSRLWHLRNCCPRSMRMVSSPHLLDYVPFFSEVCKYHEMNQGGLGRSRVRRGAGHLACTDMGLKPDDIKDFTSFEWSAPIVPDESLGLKKSRKARIADSSDDSSDDEKPELTAAQKKLLKSLAFNNPGGKQESALIAEHD